ncbi:MaoC family dehydratase [Jatrophihabitans sp. YIM 134969]
MTRWFEDYPVGSTWELGEVTPSLAEIVGFAQRFDPQPFHVDEAAAGESVFGGIIASGWHTAAMAMRLIVDEYLSPESSLGSPGVDEVRWSAPVRPDVTYRLRAEVVEARVSASKPDRGIVRTRLELTDPDGTSVFSTLATNLVLTRPAA